MKSKEEIREYVREGIDQEGFDYFFTDYVTPEYIKADVLDPELTKLWKQYISLTKEIKKLISYQNNPLQTHKMKNKLLR